MRAQSRKADAKSCRHLRVRASKPSTQNGRQRVQKVGKCGQLMGMISWPTKWLHLSLWSNRNSSCASSNLCVHIYCKWMRVFGCEYLPASLYLTSSAPYRHTKLESPFPSFFHFLSLMCYVFTGCLTQPNYGPVLVTESILVLALLFLLSVQLLSICWPCSIYLLKTGLCVCFSVMSGSTLCLTNDPIQRNND